MKKLTKNEHKFLLQEALHHLLIAKRLFARSNNSSARTDVGWVSLFRQGAIELAQANVKGALRLVGEVLQEMETRETTKGVLVPFTLQCVRCGKTGTVAGFVTRRGVHYPVRWECDCTRAIAE